jgi:hypothetical protein
MSYQQNNKRAWNSYIFLTPPEYGKYSMRKYGVLRHKHSKEALVKQLELLGDEIIHFDFETQGLSPLDTTKHVVSVSAATTQGVFVADCKHWDEGHWRVFIRAVVKQGGMAYNTGFDYKWLYAKAIRLGMDGTKVLKSICGCTLTLFRMLANERWLGQKYDLGTAQEFLRIPSNKTWLKNALEKHNLKKADMWKLMHLDYENFLKYNAEDSDTSVWLWQELCSQLDEKDMMHIISYHQNEVANQLVEFIEQWWDGIHIDREKLQQHYNSLGLTVALAEGQFKHHPRVKEYVDKWELDKAKEHYAPKINMKKVWAKKADDVPNSPDGWIYEPGRKTVAKWEEALGGRFYKPEYKVAHTAKSPPLFNLQGDSIRPLFFGHLYDYEVFEDKRRMVRVKLEDREVELRLTKKGQDKGLNFEEEVKTNLSYLPFNGDTYSIFGELGQLIRKWNKAGKEAGYVRKCLERSAADGKAHLEFISNGTMTSRANGAGGFNFLQQPKSQPYMECMVPPPGHVFVDVDVDSLEKVVQAEFSKDPALLELYASGKPHDVYLYNAMTIHPDEEFRNKLKAAYKTDKTVLDGLKKEFKTERTFMKPAVLGLDYGLYPYSLYIDWQAQGYDVTYDDCFNVFKNYWKTYAGVKEWEQELLAERESRGGWIVNSFGHPISITDDKKSAIVNTFCLDANTLVLTDTGWKQLVEVTKEDMVWDGIDWCAHDGLIYQGTKDVINMYGVVCTPDHKFLDTEGNWHEAERFKNGQVSEWICSSQQEKEIGESWTEVWQLGSVLIKSKIRRIKSLLFG